MSDRLTFVLGIHNHQPVGNFEHVFEEAYRTAYVPFLDVLERHPGVKISLHVSGPLVEWLEENHPEYFDRVARLAKAGRLEPMGGAFYEPILPSISEADASDQIERMVKWVEKRFHRAPRGAWIAERVWSAHLPRPLAKNGIRYVCLDSHHFESAGLGEEELDGYRVTEFEGAPLAAFPISKPLRYTIPFEEPEKSIEILRAAAADAAKRGRGDPVIVMADDGEKFGVWPGTYRLCYEGAGGGWLERFFTLLEKESSWLRCTTFSEALDSVPARGRIYLPDTSYKEMAEWAPGGLWRNFLVRYPESNRMQKKGLRVSAKVRAMRPGKAKEAALTALHRAQCNCGYWHGVFGGLYLNFLRGAIWQNLIEAERAADAAARRGKYVRTESVDLDMDLADEILVESDAVVATVSPRRGGAVEEISIRRAAVNLLDTLARRPEAYHEKVREAIRNPQGMRGTASIHEIIQLKQPDLDKYLVYDAAERLALQDRFVGPDFDLRGLPYESEVRTKKGGVEVRLSRPAAPGGADLLVEKTLRFEGGRAGFEASYRIRNRGAAPFAGGFAVEWSLGMQAADAPDRGIMVDGAAPADPRPGARAVHPGAKSATAVDGWRKFRATLAWDVPAELTRDPVDTVSASEAGFERAYQATTLSPRWDLRIAPGAAWEVRLRLDVECT